MIAEYYAICLERRKLIMKDEPRCTEVAIGVSMGGKVQIVTYEHDANYFFNIRRTYAIPEAFTDEQVVEFERAKYAEIYAEVERITQDEVDQLMAERDEIAAESK